MAKKTEETNQLSVFEEELAEAGLSEFFKKVLDREDMGVEVLSTGLPRLDTILHAKKRGLVKCRRVEIFSKDPEVGKTSIALQIGQFWQSQGMKVAIVDIEDTITEDYLVELKYVLDPEAGSGMYPVLLAKGFDEGTGEVLSAEQIADKVGAISRVVDLVIIDSIAALAKRADLEKDANDPSQMGGIGKILYEHCRKNTHVRATSIWINQALPQIGVFSPAGIKYKTSGGNAIPFFASIRLELRVVEKLKGKDDETYGVVVDVFTTKNKVSPPYKHVKLTYLDGEGFSPTWDLFEAAMTAKVFEKKGSWINFEDQKWQGELNVYNALKADPSLQEKVQTKLENKDALAQKA